MKRGDLIRLIEAFGCRLVRHGGNHDWYQNPYTGASQPIPRHQEIDDHFAKRIIKRLGQDEKLHRN